MRRFLGAVLIVGGAVFLYFFAAHTMFHARDLLGDTFDPRLPFVALGRGYPAGVLYGVGAAWCLVPGLAMVLGACPRAPGGAPRGGVASCTMLLNGLALVSSLWVVYAGAKGGADTAVVGVFCGVSLLQTATGLLLFVLAIFERPKGIASLLSGSLVYVGAVAIEVLVFLRGA